MMNVKCMGKKSLLIFFFLVIFYLLPLQANSKWSDSAVAEMDQEVNRLMTEGDIPGLAVVIVSGKNEPFIRGYGIRKATTGEPVDAETLFELASCSKAFTALAALQCERDGLLNLDDRVSKFFPAFYALYKGKKQAITVRQLLHQSSGIPFNSISLIPESQSKNSLKKVVKVLQGIELNHMPGTLFEYATINYDVVGAIIEKVTGISFEDYMESRIFKPLGMDYTRVGVDKINPPPKMADGHKVGFFKARLYDAPVFRGNNPAGYIISNARDMSTWLKIQLGLEPSGMEKLVNITHLPDESVPLSRMGDSNRNDNLTSYGMGWNVYLKRFKRIDHGGNNPNFTSYIIMNPQDKIGVVVLANSNSLYTSHIARSLMNYAEGKGFIKKDVQVANMDKGASVISFMLLVFNLSLLFFMLYTILDIFKGRREFVVPGAGDWMKMTLTPLVYLPFLLGIYLIPRTLAGVSMQTAIVFSPQSFLVAIFLVLFALAMGYLAIVLTTLFPHRNKYIRSIPLALVLSLLSGGANAIVIFLISTSVFSKTGLIYQVYNYALAFLVYIVGRKVLQTKLTRITFDIVYDMRMKLLEKIFYTSYQRFEKIDRGRVFATLNNDTAQIGGSAGIMVQLVTSFVTTIGAFLYLATIAFWATALTLFVIITIATLYSFVTRRTQKYFEEARETQNVFMGLLHGLVDGFKELSMQYKKKKEYNRELGETVDQFRQKQSTALIKFINAFLVGESLLLVILACVGYGIPRFFPQITPVTLMGFIMVLLYLIGPINGILNSVPAMAQLKVAWDRVQGFIKDVPANIDPVLVDAMDHEPPVKADSLEAKGVTFVYESEDESEAFSIGPIDFEARKGEIIFIVGGNGSGKTTFAKLLTGLYSSVKGSVNVDGQELNNYRLGEYFSVVFSDYHLFEKLYNVDLEGKEEEINHYLKMLRLDKKVKIQDNAFSTLELSGGQRKRLALLQCYLEDCPIYLFDEIAADQDPEFRKFFYRELLKKMKEKGKIVIAITHDDHYFDAADKVFKMDMGKIQVLSGDDSFKLSCS